MVQLSEANEEVDIYHGGSKIKPLRRRQLETAREENKDFAAD